MPSDVTLFYVMAWCVMTSGHGIRCNAIGCNGIRCNAIMCNGIRCYALMCTDGIFLVALGRCNGNKCNNIRCNYLERT